MKMAFISRVGLGLAAALVLSGSAFAASVAPPSYPFTLKGGGNLNYSNNIWPCGWTFQMSTTSSTGGTMSGGVGVSVRRAPFLTAYGVATSIRFGSRAERSKLPKPQP